MIFTESQKKLQAAVRDFAENELAPKVPEILETNGFSRELYRRFGELGFWRVGLPEEEGGTGGGQVEIAIIMEELAKVCPGFALAAEIPYSNIPVFLQEPTLKEKYAEKILTGEYVMSSGATPPEGQANTPEWPITLTPTEDGEGYYVNGTRLYGTNNKYSDVVIGYGKNEKGEVVGFAVDRDMPGWEHDDAPVKLGCAGQAGGTCTFDNVRIPKNYVTPTEIGTSETYYIVYDACAAEALGCMKGIYAKALDWICNRTSNYVPLIQHKGVAYKVAELKTWIELADSMVYDAAMARDAFVASGNPEDGDVWHMKAETAKVRVSEIGAMVCKECVKLFGGKGYHDINIYHYLGDSIDYTIMDQTNEIHFDAVLALMGLQSETE